MNIGPQNNPAKNAGIGNFTPSQNQQSEIISVDVRKRLAELADTALKNSSNSNLLSHKLAKIKNKIEAGYYELPELNKKITSKIADNILDKTEEDQQED